MAAVKENQTLMISLIISVMIAFVLAVTAYFFFQQKGKERQTADSARSDMEKANRDRDAAFDTAKRLRVVLGTDKDTADAVEAEWKDLLNSRFPNFGKDEESKNRATSILQLVEWLDGAIKKKDGQLETLRNDLEGKIKAQEEKAAQAETAQAEAQKARSAAIAQQAAQETDFQKRWEEHKDAQQKMKEKQDDALAESRQMKAIGDELAEFRALLPEGSWPKWDGASLPDRVRLAKEALQSSQIATGQLNIKLAALRLTDDERIDGFDGRIASVHSFDHTVLIVCDSTAGMRPGLVLSVYDPADPRPRSGARKALVEVIEVEGPTLARARIRHESVTDPILPNDGLATSLWTPGVALEVVIVGYSPSAADWGLNGSDGDAPASIPLKSILERNGARIVENVTPQTALVLDLGDPRAEDLVDEQRTRLWNKAKSIRTGVIKQAKDLGIRVVTLDALLDALGLDREVLDGRRLPTEVGAAP